MALLAGAMFVFQSINAADAILDLKPTPDGMKVEYSGAFNPDASVIAEEQADLREVTNAISRGEHPSCLPDWYVITFKAECFPYYLKDVKSDLVRVSVNGKTLDDEARILVMEVNGKLRSTYQGIAGFLAKIPSEKIEIVRNNPMVKNVQPNTIGYPALTNNPSGSTHSTPKFGAEIPDANSQSGQMLHRP